MYISGRTPCRKCSKCFYVYLNIRPMRYSARIESVGNARRSTDCRSVTEGKRRPSSQLLVNRRLRQNRRKRDKPVFNNTPELNVDVRLGKRLLQQRDAYASFSVERRHARIESVTNARRQRIAALSPEERDARLQQLRTAREQTIATESTEERQPRLQQLRNAQQLRIAAVPPEEREARLQQLMTAQQQDCCRIDRGEREALLQQLRTAKHFQV